MADDRKDLVIPDEAKPDDQTTQAWAAQANARLVKQRGTPFLGGRSRWYSKALEGVPFLFAGEPDFEMVHGFRKGDADREVCVVPVRLMDADGHRSRYTVVAEFSDAWVKNSIKDLLTIWSTIQDNPRMVFTIKRNPESDINETTKLHSRDLALYTEDDEESETPSTFDEPEQGPPPESPDSLATFLRMAVTLNPAFKDTGVLMAVLGVKSLRTINYPQAYETLRRNHKQALEALKRRGTV